MVPKLAYASCFSVLLIQSARILQLVQLPKEIHIPSERQKNAYTIRWKASSCGKFTPGSYEQRGVSRESGDLVPSWALSLRPSTRTLVPDLATEFEDWVNRMSLVMSLIKVDKENVLWPERAKKIRNERKSTESLILTGELLGAGQGGSGAGRHWERAQNRSWLNILEVTFSWTQTSGRWLQCLLSHSAWSPTEKWEHEIRCSLCTILSGHHKNTKGCRCLCRVILSASWISISKKKT